MATAKDSAYLTYNDDFARWQMRIARYIADRAGLVMDKSSRATNIWHMADGTNMFASGVGGPITGKAVPGITLLDDLLKGFLEAQSVVTRNYIFEWIRQNVISRRHPGASVIHICTRWHEDDPAGRLIKAGWDHVNLEAISSDASGNDQALWPEQRPLDFLHEQRREIGEFGFVAQYLGRPRPRGAEVFSASPTYYDIPPTEGMVSHGVDLAYTAKTHSDYSVVVTMRKHPVTGHMYVVDCTRVQKRTADFAQDLLRTQLKHGRAPMRFYCTGMEAETASLLAPYGVTLDCKPVTGDKFVRAQPAAAAWNAGMILVPRNAPWLNDFLNEVLGFTGVGDRHDDIVDAFAAAHDSLGSGSMQGRHRGEGSRITRGLRNAF